MSLKKLLTEIASCWVKAKKEPFKDHPIPKLLKKDLVSVIKSILPETSRYLIKASAGNGNWADVAWLSILNPVITASTQSGIYPVYLLRADGSGIYLSLGFGTTDLKKQYGAVLAKQKAEELRNRIRDSDERLKHWDPIIDLRSNTTLGKSYEWASAGAKFYSIDNFPDDATLVADLKQLLEIYSDVNSQNNKNIIEIIKHVDYKTNPLSKSFLLLAGISGTGKTRFVREQAKFTKQFSDTYCLVSVRPDWHEPSDLLGYISRLGKDGEAEYITTDVLQFIAKAWRAIADCGLIIELQDTEDLGKRLLVTGHHDDLKQVLPYWLCLDEMNLAPVEQYFADYLSVLETRTWHWDDDKSFTYSCDALLKPATIKQLAKPDALRSALELDGEEFDDLWEAICEFGLPIPFNLIVAGTVNMDETTHGFSRKVIDRALSFDFGEFFPNNYDDFFTPTSCNKRLSYPIWSNANKTDLANTFDADGTKTVAFISAVNAVLKNTPFELAFRALNELLLAVVSSQPKDDLTLKAVWDDFMMCKVLPRIEGDTDKLTTSSGKGILEELTLVLAAELTPIWDAEQSDDTNARPDLYRENALDEGVPDEQKVLRIACRSKAKLAWMQQRLNTATFTSFWP